MRILLVEDDKQTAAFIIKGLKQSGFAVDHAGDGENGLHMALTEPYDAAIIDIMLPKMDGLSLIDNVRKNKVMIPVIVLSAKSSVDDRIKGLQLGGDDYMVKPFAFAELLARIQSIIRRHSNVSQAVQLTVADLCLDIVKHKVYRAGVEISLQPLEFSLLEYLMRNNGRVVTKTMIMEHIWDYNFDPQTNVVEVRICHLRNKVDSLFTDKLIHTVRGVGYVLEKKK